MIGVDKEFSIVWRKHFPGDEMKFNNKKILISGLWEYSNLLNITTNLHEIKNISKIFIRKLLKYNKDSLYARTLQTYVNKIVFTEKFQLAVISYISRVVSYIHTYILWYKRIVSQSLVKNLGDIVWCRCSHCISYWVRPMNRRLYK